MGGRRGKVVGGSLLNPVPGWGTWAPLGPWPGRGPGMVTATHTKVHWSLRHLLVNFLEHLGVEQHVEGTASDGSQLAQHHGLRHALQLIVQSKDRGLK